MKPELITIKLSTLIFDEEIYPRTQHDPALVQTYAETLDEIEALGRFVVVSTEHKILDGKHRWLAYRKRFEGKDDPEIKAYRYPIQGWLEEFKLAHELNATHGHQTSMAEKERGAKRFYNYGVTSYDEIASWLHVSKATISAWLARTVKEERDRRNEKIRELWMACERQEAIAEACGCSVMTVNGIVQDFYKRVSENQTVKAAASHATDFEPPLYNIWKQQDKTTGITHFGNSEVRWIDNLLYGYTEPLGIVVDPFAGSGSTIDICKKRWRRYWASDRKPIIEREEEIRCWDITEGLPKIPRWQDVQLVYLDPPYWKQAEGQYSDDPTDLANMEIDDFTQTLAKVITQFGKKLPPKAAIALLLQPTQWNAPDHHYTDHIADVLRRVKLPLHMRFSCPYESQQCTAQMVEWAKATRQCLVLTRELIVWRGA